MGSDAAISVYWRPGCGFCMALERQLDRLQIPVVKHNIWDDPKASEFVRRHANNSETVPTVAVGPTVMVNPSAGQVLHAMQEHTPDLVPEGVEVPQPGKVGRLVNRLLGE